MKDERPSHHILLYANGNCPHCRAAREALVAWGEPFEERDPLASPALLKELLLVAAVGSVPTIVVSGHVLVGFDADRLQELLRLPPPEPDPINDYSPEDLSED
jgi:glutaredoxin